jgi:CheY-like chemotaxis protein
MKRVLWVEDEAKEQLLELLGPAWRAGYLVDIIEDKDTALRKIKGQQYDAYVFDLIIKRGLSGGKEEEPADDVLYGLQLIEEIFREEANLKIDPKKCVVFSVVQDVNVHNKIQKLGITRDRIIVKGEIKRGALKDIIETIIGLGEDHNV